MADRGSSEHLVESLVYWCCREKSATASKLDSSVSIEAYHYGRSDGTMIILRHSECHTAQGKQQHDGSKECLYSTNQENCMQLQEQNKVQERDSVSSRRLRSSALSHTLVESAKIIIQRVHRPANSLHTHVLQTLGAGTRRKCKNRTRRYLF